MDAPAKRFVPPGWLLLAFISLIYFCSNLQKVVVPGATFNELQQLFGADASQVTRLGAAFMYVYAFTQLLAGPLADRFSGTRVIAYGGILFLAGCFLSVLTSSLWLLVAARVLTGAGAACIYLSACKEIGRLYPQGLTFLVGALVIIGYSGGVVGTEPFIAGVHAYGYQRMMLAAALLLAVAYGLCLSAFLLTPGQPVNRQARFSPGAYAQVLRLKINQRQFLVSGIAFGTYFTIQTVIGKKFLEDFCGMSPHGAGVVLTVLMIIAASNGVLMAALSRMCGNRLLPFLRFGGFGCLGGALMLLGTVLADCHQALIPVSAMILMAFAGNVASLNVAYQKAVNDERCFGTVLSAGNSFAYLVTAVFGGLLGWLMDCFPPAIVDEVKIYGRSSYLLVFVVLAVLGAISAFSSCLLPEPPQK